MSIVNHFYNATTKKYIAVFGTIFNKLSITREDENGEEIQRFPVPISYGPWQKFLSRIKQDVNLDRRPAMTLPRMSFEITGMTYDGQRKLSSLKKLRKNEPEDDEGRNFQYVPAPYDIQFSLYIMTKYSEDAVKIVEQFLPFFKPERTTTVKLIEGLEPIDIPLILNDVSSEELYEGSYEERQSVLWTLSFTMKAYYFGPNRKRKLIKFIDKRYATRTDSDSIMEEQVTIQPGLTVDGEPTNDIAETISFDEIDYDDDWGFITIVQNFEEDE